MIRGIGIDVVTVDRMRHWLDDTDLLHRFFAAEERDAIYERKDGAVLSLAARFAAKEAFAKALGTGFKGFGLRDVWVVNDALGKPLLRVTGPAERALRRIGGSTLWLSLTHEQEHAIALVVIES